MDAAALEDWLVARVATLTDQPPGDIDPDRPMEAYGLTSVMAVTLSAELEDMLDMPVDGTIAWDYPTIHGLAEHLAAAGSGS